MSTRPARPRRIALRLADTRAALLSLGLLVAATAIAPSRLHAATLLSTLGFEDDVDLVAAPDRQFVVIPEESASGNAARLTIVDLDPTTGAPLNAAAPTVIANLLGFENGVDPIVFVGGTAPLVFVPLEKEDGSNAELMVLQVNATTGALLERIDIALGDLGFMPDVDGVLSDYPEEVAFFALQSEDGSQRGVLVVDADDSIDGDWGSCRLLSTDGRAGCGASDLTDWMPHLAVGIDPVAFRTDTSVRLALPVRYADHGDLLLLDFESDDIPGDIPPPWHGNHDSARDRNAGTARPTAFPGWEEDVDIALLPGGACGVAARSILVPVEAETAAAGDVADVYLLDETGRARWTFSHDNGLATRRVPGFERGVDLVHLCPGGGADPLLLIPWENDAGSDAGLYAVDPATGAVAYDLEVRNPPLVITGYQVGVEPLAWGSAVVVPMQGSTGTGALCSFDPATGIVATVLSLATVAPGGWGFMPSVDPIVATATVNGAPVQRLYAPITRSNGDANVLFSSASPTLEPLTIEQLNGINFGGLQVDVDIGVVDKTAPGQAFVALPEEKPDGSDARVRWEEVPSVGPHVVIATGRETIPSSLFFVHAADAQLVRRVDNLFGLETGLDMATGAGSVEMANPPDSLPTPGASTDNDTDPTLVWDDTPTGVGVLPGAGAGGGRGVVAWIAHANPFVPGGAVRYALTSPARVAVEIVDVRGRRVCRLFQGEAGAGEHAVVWDGRDASERQVAAGTYYVRVTAGGEGRARAVVVVR